MIDIATEAARLRAAAEAKPMRLPVNRKVDESHHATTPDGLSVWFTIQVSPHARIQEAVFERTDRILRPANFPTDSPGAEVALVQARDGTTVAVFTGTYNVEGEITKIA